MRRFFPFFVIFLIFFPSRPGFSQSIPALEKDPEIVTGTFTNGLSYYMVADKSKPGYADFALVQRAVSDAAVSRRALSSLPHFRTRRPYMYASDHGVGYSRRGYVSQTATSTVFRFPGVPVTEQPVCDSTLLLLFDLALTSPYEQAMIVCGDIDVSAILERMKMLSFMVPPLSAPGFSHAYSWQPSDSLSFRAFSDIRSAVSSVGVTYRLPRPDPALMNTLQVLVTKAFLFEFGQILDARVKAAFVRAGIPLAQSRFRYLSADETEGDERLTYTLYTEPGRFEEAIRLLAATLASLDNDGASVEEVRWARDLFAVSKQETRSYAERCIAACLYGTLPVAESASAALYREKRLPEEQEARLFNNFIKAFLAVDKNVHLTFSFPEGKPGDGRLCAGAFEQAWKSVSAGASLPLSVVRDTTLLDVAPRRVRLQGGSTEPVAGGEMWTFSNEMKVIYKKTDSGGTFRYALMVRGGVADIPGLAPGENAFVNDMGGLMQVAGLSGEAFSALLAANGIGMSQQISLSDYRLYGEASSQRLSLLLKALLSYADKRSPDFPAFFTYRAGEALRLQMYAKETAGLKALMDSMARPAYPYQVHKSIAHLGDKLPEKVNSYLDRQFSRLGNGLLVLVGDLDRNAALQHLCRYLGGFRTGSQRIVRPRVAYDPASCWMTVTTPSSRARVGLREKSAYVLQSCSWPVSAENAMTLQLARIVLEREMARQLAPRGACAEVEVGMEMFPAERFSLFVSAKPVMASGLPDTVRPASSMEALAAVRKSLANLRSGRLSETEFARCQVLLEKQMEAWLAAPGNLVSAILDRNSNGLDIASDYRSRIRSIRRERLCDLLWRLGDGRQIEYVIL